MIHLLPSDGQATWRRAGLLALLVLPLAACDSTGPPNAAIGPPAVDTTPLPPITPDTVPGPDSLVPPPDTTGPVEPPVVVTHLGIPFGPFALPSSEYGAVFTGAYRPAWIAESLLIDLEAARRASTRVFLNFTGNESALRDEKGFSLAKWKQRVDRYRGIDFTSYIADGTVIGHFIMDEPSDAGNWNGKLVSLAEVDEMARYSKEIWPTMATIIRARPDYLQGYQYKYLDATWAHYLHRLGSLEDFIAKNISEAKAVGLAFVTGLNVLNGGSPGSGIPGRKAGKFAMSASEIREWGGRLLAEPYICAFIMWKYDSKYFARPDISAAIADLRQKAENHPKKACRPG